jgi:hypothetical protein
MSHTAERLCSILGLTIRQIFQSEFCCVIPCTVIFQPRGSLRVSQLPGSHHLRHCGPVGQLGIPDPPPRHMGAAAVYSRRIVSFRGPPVLRQGAVECLSVCPGSSVGKRNEPGLKREGCIMAFILTFPWEQEEHFENRHLQFEDRGRRWTRLRGSDVLGIHAGP